MMSNRKIIVILTIIASISGSCGKGYLEVKPDKGLVVPELIEDFQALLDNTSIGFTTYGGLPNIAADEFFRL